MGLLIYIVLNGLPNAPVISLVHFCGCPLFVF